jgi:putative colanic acid biosynthesis UDP-glucose lipid carrier transferase
MKNTEYIIRVTLKSIFAHLCILFIFIVALKSYEISRIYIFITYGMYTVLLLCWRIGTLFVIKYRPKLRKIIIIGAGGAGNIFYNFIKNDKGTSLHFLGFFDDFPNSTINKKLVIGNVEESKKYALDNKIDEIYCALPLTSIKTIRNLMTFADNHLIKFTIVPNFSGFQNKRVNIEFYGGKIPVLNIRTEPLSIKTNLFLKRIFDIVFSILVIVFVYPIIIPIISILIKKSSPGPVFYGQNRSGKNNVPFKCLKFRTMYLNEDSDTKQASINDDRVTAIGRFLRKTNLDELPQFINVIKGEMSVVGPRPHMLKHTAQYAKIIDKYMVRNLIKPGITGWAQINGYRGGTGQIRLMIKRVRYDIWYLENWSILLDIQIIFLTVYNMFNKDKNAY